ncbi:hypothetical protein L6164_001734 [Bauhinia variegata]|uniref:Uncharacterized protein n=1 Tax=Bauhinia variegata TaxID=167791 RepID=A0ACB9QB01_BAUVA|nr:hypothetical protein L6164_001734 [Bauhinia variegata]
MSPAASFHEQPKKVINGPRPSPLMIKRESHLIRKSSNSFAETKPHQVQQPRNPIIIYTYSPKVIHTKARDFMALVQRLTGLSPKARVSSAASLPPQPQHEATEKFGSKPIKQEQSVSEGNKSSSGLTVEEAFEKGSVNIQLFSPLSNVGFAEFPLFTPNSSDFFRSSPQQVHIFPDSPFGNLASLISPSGLEFLKELPEY